MAEHTRTIVCFGDSNTYGYNACTHGRFIKEERWTGLLATMLGSNYSVKEEGKNGRTTIFEDPFTEGLCGIKDFTSCLMEHKPVDLLLIMLGTNDTKSRLGKTVEQIATGMKTLVQEAIMTKDAWIDKPNILIMAPPPIEPAYIEKEFRYEMGAGCDRKSAALAHLYKQIASSLHCHFLDVGSLTGMVLSEYDYLHLTKDSHLQLASQLATLIPTYF